MKFIFNTLTLISFLFISFTSTEAATITWLGGNGAWEDSSEWDSGTVPSFGDDVIIPSGYCRIYGGDSETATSVEVQSSGRLYIYEDGQLEISGAVNNDGLHNMGRVYIYGFLAINDISQTNSSISAKAIHNEKYIFTYSNSQINIKYIDDKAILNTAAISYFRIRGGLWIYSVNNTAISNQNRFYNYGTIDVENSGLSSGFLISNSDDFRNLNGGVINLESDIYGGISNGSSNSNFRNYGDINIDEVSIGINNQGNLTNYSTGFIECRNNSVSLYNRLGGTITNWNDMKSYDSNSGIYNYGDLYNHDSFMVFHSTGNGSVRNFSTGFIDNYDDLYLLSDSYWDISNQGEIINRNGAIIEINKTIDMSSGSSLSNYGFIASHTTYSHNIDGSFGNKGVIDDNHGMLQGLFANDRLIVAPVAGPMQVGIPFPNVLDVASLDDITIGTWKISQNGASAGTYNETTNEFTPNSASIGISTIYISIEDDASGYARNFSLEIGSPILPFAKSGQSSSTRNGLNSEFSNIEENEIQVFPNPTSGMIQLKSNAFENNSTNVQIFNSMGQLVQQEKFDGVNNAFTIDFSDQLTNGVYFVKTIQNGTELGMKRIQLFR